MLCGLLLPGLCAAQRISAPASLTVGNQRVAVAGSPIDVPLQNVGAAPLRITAMAFSGANAADFSAVSMPTVAMPIEIAPGGSGAVQLSFKPPVVGPRSAQLTLSSNDPMTPSVVVGLSGSGVVAGFAMSPMSLAFARQRTAGCGGSQLVRIENPGSDNLRVSSLSFTGPAASSFKTAARPFTIAAGGTGYVDVSLCPLAIGALSASLVVATDYQAGHKAEVALTGTAFGPLIEVSPLQVDYGTVFAGSSTTRTVTVKNPGDEATAIATVALQGGDLGQFSLAPVAPGTQLKAGASIGVDVTAKPGAAGTIRSDLVITLSEDLGPGKELRLPLSATATVSTVSLSPATIDCGTQFVGAVARCKSDLVIRNTSAVPLEGLMIAPNLRDFFVENVPASVPPMQTVQLPVSFRPTQGGARAGNLVVRGKGLLGTNQISVTGKGQGVSIQLSPDLLEFGVVAVGAEPVTRQLVLVNQGDAVIEVTAAVDPAAPEAAEFTLDAAALSLSPGEPQSLAVRFTPQVSGDKALSLQILHQGSGEPIQSIELSGKAYDAPPPPSMNGCAAAGGPGSPAGAGGFAAAALLLLLVAARPLVSRGRPWCFPRQRKPW